MKPYHWTKINEFFTDIDLQPLLSSAVMPDNQEKWGKKRKYTNSCCFKSNNRGIKACKNNSTCNSSVIKNLRETCLPLN